MTTGEATPKGVAELTVRAVGLGLVLSGVMAAANVYLGLKAGMTVSASIPAAVVAMVLLRGVLRTGTVLEANQVQTAASAGESLAAGIIFTMPALILIGAWEEFDYAMTTVIAFTGGLLGILFMIPMRRVFVVDNDELKYPEGVACAAVLEAGGATEPHAADGADGADGATDAKPIVIGGLLGAGFKALGSFAGLLKGTLEGATFAGSGRVLFFGADISPALVGVGLIVGLNVSLLIFIGGAIGWLIGIPLLDASGHDDAHAAAWALWSTKIRYVGVGAMVVGGVSSIWKVRGGLLQAVRELSKRFQKDAVPDDDDELGRDLPSPVILGLSALATVLVAGTYYVLTGNVAITVVTTVVMLVMSFFFTAVASYIVGLVGNSNSPVSGMTITAVLFTGLMLAVFGFSGEEGMVATLGVAAIVCCAACTSGDVCNDLKTGSLVGARPYRQQIMQVGGVAVAAVWMAPILQLLHENTPGGIGGRELPAPQAGLFASLVRGFFGDGKLPWDMVAWGAGVGVIILVVDLVLEKRKAAFRAHLMPIAVGMYLPFGLAVPILAGGVINHLLSRGASSDREREKKARRGVLLASGVIAGESLTGVGIAVLAAVGVSRLDLGLSDGLVAALTFAAAAFALGVFYVVSRARER